MKLEDVLVSYTALCFAWVIHLVLQEHSISRSV